MEAAQPAVEPPPGEDQPEDEAFRGHLRRNHFIFYNVLGRGRMATVTRVARTRTHREYAIKEILEQKVRNDETAWIQFKREIQLQFDLRHPNVLRSWGYFKDGPKYFIVLDLAKRGNLLDYLEKQPNAQLAPSQAAKFAKDVIFGLMYLHEKKIIHRDIKPENLLLKEVGGTLMIGDFGCCVRQRNDQARFTFIGTLDYLAPEVIEGQPQTEKVDIWSLGVLIYEFVVGTSSFEVRK